MSGWSVIRVCGLPGRKVGVRKSSLLRSISLIFAVNLVHPPVSIRPFARRMYGKGIAIKQIQDRAIASVIHCVGRELCLQVWSVGQALVRAVKQVQEATG